MYQLDDLGLARASVRIVFSSVKRRSIQKLQPPPPPPPSPLPENSPGIRSNSSRGQNYYSSAGLDGKFFYKRQDQWMWLSCRPFLLSHLLAQLNSLPLNSSMLKDKTRVFHRKDLTTSLRQGSSSPPFGKNDSQMPECCLGGDVKASIWLALYLGMDIALCIGSHFHLGAF